MSYNPQSHSLVSGTLAPGELVRIGPHLALVEAVEPLLGAPDSHPRASLLRIITGPAWLLRTRWVARKVLAWLA